MAKRVSSALRRFLDSEARGGILLIGAAALALLAANGGAADLYHDLLETALGPLTVEHWINDALMALFFLLVGLEIKRELAAGGSLATWRERRLPLIAAAAGMAVPALVYLAVAGGDPALRPGWAIPAATDIAFALAVLALLGRRAPASLKLLLTTIAIADDLGAVAIIALAYTASLNLAALAAASALFGALWLAGRRGLFHIALFAPAAVLLWYLVHLSGVHATIAGVLAAFAVPAGGGENSPLHRLEHGLAPWVAYLILPLFGFANAGVALGLGGLGLTLPLAIALGLFLGKQAGIFSAIWACDRLGFAPRPAGCGWHHIYGLSLLCGIGFTMSLFIGALAFAGRPELAGQAKAGILLGSLLSAVAGYFVLRFPASPGPDRAASARLAASD
jgi:NhaA family Na+:H+ antiporter